MDFWIVFIAIIAFSLIYKALFNYSKLKKVQKLHEIYKNNFNKFVEESQIALSIFKEAGLEDSFVRVTTKSDLVLRTAMQDIPQYHQQSISVFKNLTFNHKDVIPAVNGLFMKSKGIFRHRLKETINPLHWIQFIINLPSYLMKYLGLGESNIFMKLTQLVYWILGMVKMLHDLKIIDIQSIIN